MNRYTFISINTGGQEHGMELLCSPNTVETDADVETALNNEYGWLQDIGEDPCGKLVQHDDGYWHFEDDTFLRIYVQVG